MKNTFNKLQSQDHIDFKDNDVEALDWGNEKYFDWWKDLSIEKKRAILKYSKSESEKINQFLTINDEKKFKELFPDIDTESLKKEVESISAALSEVQTPEPIIVYRRIPEQFIDEKILKLRDDDNKSINLNNFRHLVSNFKNYVFTNHGFMSTSLTSNLKNFSVQHRNLSILMVIDIPQGINAGFLAGWQNQKSEREFLIQHGYDFKFIEFHIVEENKKEIVKAKVELIKKS